MRFTLLNSHQFLLGAFLIKNALSADFITKGRTNCFSPLGSLPPLPRQQPRTRGKGAEGVARRNPFMSMGIHNVKSDGTSRLRGTNPAMSHRLTVPGAAGADRPDSRKASPPLSEPKRKKRRLARATKGGVGQAAVSAIRCFKQRLLKTECDFEFLFD
jgi:hypothetical protein